MIEKTEPIERSVLVFGGTICEETMDHRSRNAGGDGSDRMRQRGCR
jgi:hypothetical protein